MPAITRRALRPAVVADVDHDGVLAQAVVVKMLHQFTAGLVKPLHHRVVLGVAEVRCLVLVFLQQPLRRGMRGVRQERRVPDQERFVLVPRFLDKIIDRLHAGAADPERFRGTVPLRGTHAVRKPGHLFGIALPVFTGMQAQVAGFSEQSRQLRMPGVAVDPFLSLSPAAEFFRRVVAGPAVLVRIQPGHHRRQRRRAQGRGDITAGKHQAFTGQLIEMRRADDRVSHEPVIVVSLVIADDHHEIRFGCRLAARLAPSKTRGADTGQHHQHRTQEIASHRHRLFFGFGHCRSISSSRREFMNGQLPSAADGSVLAAGCFFRGNTCRSVATRPITAITA